MWSSSYENRNEIEMFLGHWVGGLCCDYIVSTDPFIVLTLRYETLAK